MPGLPWLLGSTLIQDIRTRSPHGEEEKLLDESLDAATQRPGKPGFVGAGQEAPSGTHPSCGLQQLMSPEFAQCDARDF